MYKRGVKYPEKAINFSNSATTVMVCSSADGVLLSLYIILKNTHLYDTWIERHQLALLVLTNLAAHKVVDSAGLMKNFFTVGKYC